MKHLTLMLVMTIISILSFCTNPICKNTFTDSKYSLQRELTEQERWALFIGKIYYLTNPAMELDNLFEFDVFLLELSGESDLDLLFAEDGTLISYMKQAGNKMISTAIGNFDREGNDRAYGRALEMGATMEQATAVRDNLSSGSSDLLALGSELLWLADVLPSYVDGDYTLFNTTGTESRMAFRQVKGIIENVGGETLNYYMNMYQDYLIYEVSLLTYYALFY